VDLDVGRVVELASQDGTRGVRGDFLGALVGAGNTLGGRGQHQFGAEGAQQSAALLREALRQGDDHLVTAGGAHPGERDAGVARRALDDGPARLQGAVSLGCIDDGHADAVLDRVGGVVELELAEHRGVGIAVEPVDLDEGCAADQLGRVFEVRHLPCLLSTVRLCK